MDDSARNASSSLSDGDSSAHVPTPRDQQGMVRGSSRDEISWYGFLAVSIVTMAPLQLLWAVEYVLMSPMLLQNGASEVVASYAWVPSPCIQLFLCPWVGQRSDATNNRTFYLMFASFTACGLMAFVPFANFVGGLLGDEANSEMRPASIALLSICFPLADMACSVTEQFVRVMVTDLAGNDKRLALLGHGVMSAVAGLGSAMGYGIGAVNWTKLLEPNSNGGGAPSSAHPASLISLSTCVLSLTGVALLLPGASLGVWLYSKWVQPNRLPALPENTNDRQDECGPKCHEQNGSASLR